jgi:hypothetical protein
LPETGRLLAVGNGQLNDHLNKFFAEFCDLVGVLIPLVGFILQSTNAVLLPACIPFYGLGVK